MKVKAISDSIIGWYARAFFWKDHESNGHLKKYFNAPREATKSKYRQLEKAHPDTHKPTQCTWLVWYYVNDISNIEIKWTMSLSTTYPGPEGLRKAALDGKVAVEKYPALGSSTIV